MNKTIKKYGNTFLKIVFIVFISYVVISEFKSVLSDFSLETFINYADKLTISNLSIIIVLGIISYIPLSFYDFILKNRAEIEISNKKLYKLSWIASSIASVAGFGGTSAIAIKSNLYKDYTKDKGLLLKEISRIVALNLTGFSMVCLVYTLINIKNLKLFKLSNIIMYLIALYLPFMICFLIYKKLKSKDKDKTYIKDSLKIMSLSILEWITTIILIYSIIYLLGDKIPFLKFFPIFVLSISLGVIGMTPGGIGTFDLTMVVGLKSFGIPSEKALLALFLYRISYYIIPLIIGIILLINELWYKMNNELKNIVLSMISKVSYILLTFVIFLAGILVLFMDSYPIVKVYQSGISNGSFEIVRDIYHISLGILSGFLLITIFMLLIYKSKDVFKLSIFMLAVWGIMTLFYDVNIFSSEMLIIAAILLYLSRNEFYRESFVIKPRFITLSIFILVLFEIAYIYVCYNALKSSAQIEVKPMIYILAGITTINLILSISTVFILNFKNKFNQLPKNKLESCKDLVDKILDEFGGNGYAHYVYLRDKYIYINKDNDVFFQYQVKSNKIYVLGSPIGNPDNIFNAMEEFYSVADNFGYTVVYLSVSQDVIPYLHAMGYQFFNLGEDANVNLETFTLEGRKMKSVRNALSRVEKSGYTFEIVKPPFTDELFEQLQSVSDEWLAGKKELGFSIGSFDREYLKDYPIAIIRNEENEIKGFANVMPMYDNNETLSIDLMRFSNDVCNGIMDFIFVNMFLYGKEMGYSKFNMGLSPLSNVGTSKYSFLDERIGQQIFLKGHKFYSFEGLKKFKEKYCELWSPRYLAYRKGNSLISIMIGMILLMYVPNKNIEDGKLYNAIKRFKNL